MPRRDSETSEYILERTMYLEKDHLIYPVNPTRNVASVAMVYCDNAKQRTLVHPFPVPFR